jgi:O-antigen/teichoic acid export membrane protein
MTVHEGSMNNRSIAETRTFSRDLVWVTLSQGLNYLLIGVVTLPAITKAYSTEIYGVWVQASLTATWLAPVLNLQFGKAIVRFLAAEDDIQKRRQALGAMLWPVLVLAIVAVAVLVPLNEKVSSLLFASPHYAPFVQLVLLWAIMEGLFMFLICYLQARRRMQRLAAIQIVLALAKMALVFTLSGTGYSLQAVIIALIAVDAFVNALVLGMIIREIGWPKPSCTGLSKYLALSLPNIPGVAFLWIISCSDRYFIAHYISLSEAGIYSASYTLGSLLALFFNPINFVLFPVLSRHWEQKEFNKVKNYLEYSTKVFLLLAIPAALGLWVLSQPLLRVLSTSEYAVGGALVLTVASGYVFYGIYYFNVYIVFLVKQTKWLPLMIGVAAAVNTGLNIALIPSTGAMGAAISTLVSYLVLAAIVTIWARRAVSYRLDYVFLFKVAVAAAVMTICVRLIPVSGVLGIALVVIVGLALFAVGLLALRAFSKDEWQLIREVLGVRARLTAQHPSEVLPQQETTAPGQSPDEEEIGYWLAPVQSDEEATAEEAIETLVGKEKIFAFGERTPGRKRIKPGDWICFYAATRGVVAHAQVTSTPEKGPNPKVRHPEKYQWTFSLGSTNLYLDNPIVLDASLRSRLGAFDERDPNKAWGWFVTATRGISAHDFKILTGQD